MKLTRTLSLATATCVALSGMAASQSWQPLKNEAPFLGDTMVLFQDGSLMVHEYSAQNKQTISHNWKLTPDNTGSYLNGTWTQLASLPSGYGPLYYSSQVLPDGRVIYEGGEYNFGMPVETKLGAIYDPLKDTWTSTTAPSGWGSIGDAQSVVLPNGTYMQANEGTTQEALLNATTLTWTTTGTGKADINSEEGWNLLQNGFVLTVDTFNFTNPRNSEVYSPKTGSWQSAGDTQVQLWDTHD
nr:hypothetical protein [Terriglobales bacterium]